jgi:predicted MPP superfamily phosphohydrolase
VAAIGAGCLAWAAGYEVRAFRLRRFDVPVLAAGSPPLRVLHLSDLHLTPRRRETVAWVRGLASLEPDLVIDTGDNLAHLDAVPTALEALEPLLERPGAFVLGSNDYFGPRPKNPLGYFGGPSLVHGKAPRLPTRDLVDGLTAAGWLDLTNTSGALEVAGRQITFVGVDDPHLGRDDFEAARRGAPGVNDADLRIGVTHAPYRHVLDRMTDDGSDLVLAGHTHGGQVAVPLVGALVSNCDLPLRYAKGLHRWRHGQAESLLHVSAGLGTSPYAPIRFACPPEATLLTLVARK